MNAATGPDSLTVITKDTTNQLRDGMYLVISEIKNEADTPDIIGPNRFVVKCSDMLIENNEGEYIKMIIDTTGFVPLILRINPKTEQQTETKKRIEIELTKSSADKLEHFTTVNLNKRIALIIGGEVISAHKIKMPITGGRFQISYCGPDMCEILESRLINNVDSTGTK
ncbi:MAG: hypothetical protein LWX07_03485 [Bacteroidetes bacterium]|nr:hypothetical protein [Bacteroidota bacterium]